MSYLGNGTGTGRRALYLLAGVLLCGLLVGTGSAGAAAAVTPGSLDQSFGVGGKVLTDIGAGVGIPDDAVLQSNGDIVVSGGFGLARYLPDGQLDGSFGTGGLVSIGGNGDSGTAVAVQPDGKIVWVGSQSNPDFPLSGSEFSVARFNSNGTPDTGFGGGRVGAEFFSPPLQGAQESADAVLVQPDGKILVAGSARQGQNKFAATQGAIARLNPDGSLDTGFGTGGKILSGTGNGPFATLGLDTAGDIFTLPALTEFSPSGHADASVAPAAITASSHGGGAAFLPSGRFVIASTVGVAKHDTDIQVQRFNAGGSLASTSPAFDFSGAAGLDQARDSAAAVAVAANGQAVTDGSHFLGGSTFGLARVNPDGSLDASFGTAGTLTTSFNGDDGADAILVQPDGKIVTVGFSENNTTGHVFIALARYNQ